MIPLASPTVSNEGIEHVSTLLEDGTLSTGTVVSEFEAAIREMTARQHGIAVASGSVALELALEATFKQNATIAVSPYNCGSVLYSILRTGLSPVFVDADPTTGSLSADALASTEADGVLLSHLFGMPARVNDILDAAAEIDATVVEDFAQAPGATVRDRSVGSFGHVSICSFGATKNLTTAEGGIVVTDDEEIATHVRNQRSNTGDVSPPPRSVRMNDIEAAIGLSQLTKYDDVLERKRAIADIYRQQLESVETLPIRTNATHVYHAFPLFHEQADALASYLETEDIGTSRLYDTPLDAYETAPSTNDRFPVAHRFSEKVVLLPIHTGVSDADARTVTSTVEAFCSNQ